MLIPVVHMPHGIEVTDIESCSPEELGVPRGRETMRSRFSSSDAGLRYHSRLEPLGLIRERV